MSETQYGSNSSSSDGPRSENAEGAMQQVSDLAEDLKKQASGVAQDVTRQVKEQASQLAESAKDAASGAGERLRNAAEDQKNAGADFVSGLAGAVRRAAGEFDDQIPQAGLYIRRAAEQIDGASDALRQRDLSELLEGVQDFARRQPTAFLGMTVLAGFAAVRFLKSSTSSRQGGESRSRRNEGQDFSPRGPQSENARYLAGAGSGMSQNQRM